MKNAFDAQKWTFFHLNYDCKQETENLLKSFSNKVNFPQLSVFHPEILMKSNGREVEVYSDNDHVEFDFTPIKNDHWDNQAFIPLLEKQEYIQLIEKLQNHIQRGDIYEVNYCQEFFLENQSISPQSLYERLMDVSPTPFSTFYQCESNVLISATPERFLKKSGNRLLSQPIKGTVKRGESEEEDVRQKNLLANSLKDQNENVMIVDLVRNDLSQVCKAGTVKVDELFGIYSFSNVHQMISTISGEIKRDIHPIDALKKCFPMGSMTGAPKVKAMELIDKYEVNNRGLYSGTVGYITPNGDFDSNVIIRSFFYNSDRKYLSFWVGGAITKLSDPEKEYDECLVKAASLLKSINAHVK